MFDELIIGNFYHSKRAIVEKVIALYPDMFYICEIATTVDDGEVIPSMFAVHYQDNCTEDDIRSFWFAYKRESKKHASLSELEE